MSDPRATRAAARGTINITWGVVRGRKIHLACAEIEDATVAWAAFNGPQHPGADEPCERCGLALSKVPDP